MEQEQLTADDIKRMSAERRYGDIEQARKDGRLDTYLGVDSATTALHEKIRGSEQLTKQDVKMLYSLREYQAIVQADSDGRITYNEENN